MKTTTIELPTDVPIPSLLTIPEAAIILRGRGADGKAKPAAITLVRKMLAERKLRKGYGGAARGSTIYIKASSLRDCVGG